ncbi:type III PLP-dependent enzyme [Sphaerisporangium album]|nr:type III PLP-dependent enzyme [Sphaerisporangium album]
MHLAAIRDNYTALQQTFGGVDLYYAVKANGHAEVLRTLAALGACFDVAGAAEARACLDAGVSPAAVAWTNPIKKRTDIAAGYQMGVRLFVSDNANDIERIALHAPGSAVLVRITVPGHGAAAPFGDKFGCPPDQAVHLLRHARRHGLVCLGVSWHVGSQQSEPGAWETGIASAAQIFAEAARYGIDLSTVDLGGGLPVSYTAPVPSLEQYADAIDRGLARHFGAQRPRAILEPGRAVVATAGTIIATVVQVATRRGRRWVYLDIGRYGGLAETEGEAITYPITAARHDPGTGPVVLAGPTADGDDVIYQQHQPWLPLSLVEGDRVVIGCAGAYTASYSSVSFCGLSPLSVVTIDQAGDR